MNLEARSRLVLSLFSILLLIAVIPKTLGVRATEVLVIIRRGIPVVFSIVNRMYICEQYNKTFDRLCGLVVRVSVYRYRGPGFDPRRYQIF